MAKTRNLGQFKGGKRENHITIVQGPTAEEDKPAGGLACTGTLFRTHELWQWRPIAELLQILLFAWPPNRIFSDSLVLRPKQQL